MEVISAKANAKALKLREIILRLNVVVLFIINCFRGYFMVILFLRQMNNTGSETVIEINMTWLGYG